MVETWLKDWIKTRELLYDNYYVHRIDRQYNKGGGLCFLVKKGFNSCLENVLITPSLEILHISLENNFQKPIQCVLIYHPPSSSVADFIQNLSEFLNNVNYSTLPFLLFGDFNHDLIKINHSRDPLLQCLNSYALFPAFCFPTHFCNSSESCIDWLVYNDLGKKYVCNIEALNVGFSNHSLVCFSYKNLATVNPLSVFKKFTSLVLFPVIPIVLVLLKIYHILFLLIFSTLLTLFLFYTRIVFLLVK